MSSRLKRDGGSYVIERVHQGKAAIKNEAQDTRRHGPALLRLREEAKTIGVEVSSLDRCQELGVPLFSQKKARLRNRPIRAEGLVMKCVRIGKIFGRQFVERHQVHRLYPVVVLFDDEAYGVAWSLQDVQHRTTAGQILSDCSPLGSNN